MLIKCHECGGKVSTEAKACVHCGAPVRGSKVITEKPKTPVAEPRGHPQATTEVTAPPTAVPQHDTAILLTSVTAGEQKEAEASHDQIEIKDGEGKIHKIKNSKVVATIKHMAIRTSLLFKNIDKTCYIRQGESEWYPLTQDFCQEIINAEGDVALARKQYELGLRSEKEAAIRQREQAQAAAVESMNELKDRCRKGTWSWGDAQYIAGLLSKSNTTADMGREGDTVSQARNELMNEAIRSTSLMEAIKLVYARAQLEPPQHIASSQQGSQSQQIQAASDQLSTKQGQTNTNPPQNQQPKVMLSRDAQELVGYDHSGSTSDKTIRVPEVEHPTTQFSEETPMQIATKQPQTENKWVLFAIAFILLVPVYMLFLDAGPLIFVPMVLAAWAIARIISAKIQKPK